MIHQRGRLLVAALGFAVVAAGCAVSPDIVLRDKPITDFKQVAGSWNGWMTNRTSAAQSRVNLIIEADGRYLIVVERHSSFPGQFVLEDGALRYRHGTGFWVGKATVVEGRGKEYLRFVHDAGALFIECERASR